VPHARFTNTGGRFATLAIVAAIACGCTPRHGVENLVLYDRVVRSADIPYGTDARQRLDVYHERRAGTSAPVVVFIYAGRWKYGSKRDYLLIGNTLARRGWIVVIPDYRLFPAVRFPAWVDDGASAVRWTRDNIARFGGDASNIVVIGHSAGAHTVAMLALDEHFLRDAGVPASAVRGFVSLAGPVDTTWTAPDVQELMGPREGWAASYPYNFIDGNEQPLLLLHGASDDVVSVGNSLRLADRIHARGGCARATVYPRIGHIEIAVALAFPSLDLAPVMRDVSAFVHDPAGFACGSR
jgi:acetyl esterase/lipase